SSAQIVEIDHGGPIVGHVVVNWDYIGTVLAERFQHRRDFVFKHSDVASDRSVALGSDKRGPRVQPHAGIDRRTVVFHGNVVTSDSDFIDSAGLLARMANELG